MWENIKQLIGGAAPLIGTLVGGPAGTAVGALVAKALGTDTTPEAIEAKVTQDPQALLTLTQLENQHETELKALILQHAQLESDERKLALTQQHATIRKELDSEDAYVRRWRPTFGYAVCAAWCLLFFGLAVAMVVYPAQAATLINSVVALTPLFSVALAVLGLNIHKRSQDKQGVGRYSTESSLTGIIDTLTPKKQRE
ncbi:3TM-type holin [Vibrio coralliilyticus]|uniref:3TM-type holin n=1 Tax=Vibrio coralliilyticus TaxID=190893 RepID=UPI0018466F31|nr:3TM-type holin [Vibrio coralliilyticus]NUW66935.1 hypothetical protein [Vibrio coralliilyticus]